VYNQRSLDIFGPFTEVDILSLTRRIFFKRRREGDPVRFLTLIALAVMAAVPASAQLYSYRNQEGKLVITDRPLEKKGYELVDKYIPRRVKEERKRLQEEALAESRRARGRYTLSRGQIAGLVEPIAKAMEVDPDLVKAVIEIESSRNARAKSHKGAMGLMQLIPETAERFGVNNPWDPRQNVKGGILYLRYLLSYFRGNVDYVLAAYNAGENAVDRFGGIPPYKETRNYVRKIRRIYKSETLPYDRDVAKRPSALTVSSAGEAKPELKGVASAE